MTLGGFGPNACGFGNVLLQNNDQSPDAFHPHYFSGVELVDTNVNASLAYFHPPNPEWARHPRARAVTAVRSDGCLRRSTLPTARIWTATGPSTRC
jgi:hypothetical protein